MFTAVYSGPRDADAFRSPAYVKHNRSGMVAVLGPFEALPCYIHTYTYQHTWVVSYAGGRGRTHKSTYETGLSQNAVWHTLHEEQLCPFHVHIVQGLQTVLFAFSSIDGFYTKL
jgi:hypothetical protein